MNESPLRYLQDVAHALTKLSDIQIEASIKAIRDAWQRDAQIITCGNGGSALIAQHYITDWNKFISRPDKPFRGRCLLDNIGQLTAAANDHGYDRVFRLQLEHVLNFNDLVIGISGSGESENVLEAIHYAKSKGADTLGICGFGVSTLLKSAKTVFHVPVSDMQVVEDVFATFGHLVMRRLRHV